MLKVFSFTYNTVELPQTLSLAHQLSAQKSLSACIILLLIMAFDTVFLLNPAYQQVMSSGNSTIQSVSCFHSSTTILKYELL